MRERELYDFWGNVGTGSAMVRPADLSHPCSGRLPRTLKTTQEFKSSVLNLITKPSWSPGKVSIVLRQKGHFWERQCWCRGKYELWKRKELQLINSYTQNKAHKPVRGMFSDAPFWTEESHIWGQQDPMQFKNKITQEQSTKNSEGQAILSICKKWIFLKCAKGSFKNHFEIWVYSSQGRGARWGPRQLKSPNPPPSTSGKTLQKKWKREKIWTSD